MSHRPKFTAVLGAEAVAASTAYVLVDLSDTTNYPHTKTGEIHLLGLDVNIETQSDGIYDMWIGVITEVDATNGTADWVHVFHEESTNNPTDSTDRFNDQLDFTLGGSNDEGINLNITGGAMTRIVTNLQQAGHVNWQTDTGLASPVGAAAGATGKPGVGDLVVWVEEVSGTGTIDFMLKVIYETA